MAVLPYGQSPRCLRQVVRRLDIWRSYLIDEGELLLPKKVSLLLAPPPAGSYDVENRLSQVLLKRHGIKTAKTRQNAHEHLLRHLFGQILGAGEESSSVAPLPK